MTSAQSGSNSIRNIRTTVGFVTVVFVLVLNGTRLHGKPTGDYTTAQAESGKTIYTAQCAQCHGAELEGQSGPPLLGASFKQFLKGSGTAAALYDFTSKQMPANAPGSLSKQNYIDVIAYILARNGYPSGDQALTTNSLRGVKLTGVQTQAASADMNNEIVKTAPPSGQVFGPLPSNADVGTTDAAMKWASKDDKDWLLHGRTYANDRYSPLTDINTDNVTSLVPSAIVQTGMTASFETTPIVTHGVMYLATGVVSKQMKVMALNAASGERIWETTLNLADFQICCGPVNRGVAVGYGKVYVVTLDDKLVALNATDGKELWEKTVADPTVGYSETMAPQIYNGMVIIGSAGGEWAIRGFVAAYDANNGDQKWRWDSTDPKSFAGDSWKSGGGMVWTTPAIDPDRGLVIFSTGNPNPDLSGTDRAGDNLYTDSIVALDVNTGQLRWYYQEVKHDVWDYDAVSNVVLFDVEENGTTVPAAGEAGKVGWVFIVDRTNGRLIRKSDPYVMMSKNMFSMPTKVGVDMLPGANGGAEWSPPAYSPQTHMLYVLAMDQLMRFTTEPPAQSKGQIRLGSAFTNVEKNGIQDGPLVAVDVNTGKIAWQYKAPQPLIGGALATGGNLVFMGEGNGWFDAFDARNGDLLWRYQLGAGVNAPPITYQVNGEQYIAVAAGGNFQLGYPYGDAVAIFKLKPTK